MSYQSPVPKFLGLLQQEVPAIVLDSQLVVARSYLLKNAPMTRMMFLTNIVKPFVLSVGNGLEFLHIKKLVHMEVSLDSILVDCVGF